MKTRFIALILCFALIISLQLPASATTVTSVDEILSDFHTEIFDAIQGKQNTRTAGNDATESIAEIQHSTVLKLQSLGYDAYEITSSNYDDMQDTLDTDLSVLGLSKECSYIVVVGNNAVESSNTRSTIGSTYTYTYDGTTYTMRTIKVTSADDSNYMQATSKDLMTSHSDSVVQALLDATIGAYAELLGVPSVFGTIASLTGLTKVNLTPAKSTATYNAGSTWTRTYTQVWDDNFSAWTYGSCVEYVTQVCYVNGLSYNATTDRYEEYTTGKQQDVTRSQYYYSSTWKNEQAIIGLLTAWPVFYDKTGDAYYTYKSSTIITHKEGF